MFSSGLAKLRRGQMIRKILSSARYLARLHELAWRRAVPRAGAVVLMYHRVDPPNSRPDLHVGSLYGVERGVPVEVFEQQMRFMAKHFDPRPTTDLWPEDARRPGFAVTFDDGYADNLHLAAPVLSRLGIPATVFLSTDFIGTDRRFWWETLGAMFRETRVPELRSAGACWPEGAPSKLPAKLLVSSQAERGRAHWVVSEALMRTPADTIDAVFGELGRALEVDVRREERDWPLLTWEQVRELMTHGFDIGAHGAGHLNLGLAPDEVARDQVARSVTDVAERTDRAVRTFAFPYGGPEHRSPAALDAVREAGCEWAFTTELGVATPHDGPLVLPRAGLTRGDSLACAYQIDEAFRHARASRPGDD